MSFNIRDINRFVNDDLEIVDENTRDLFIEKCTSCKLYKEDINKIRVLPRGKFNSEIMIIAMAPSNTRRSSKETHMMFPKEPMYDFFFEAIEKSNIEYDSAYFTNLIKCSCVDGNFSDRAVDCDRILKKEIELTNPKLIILLGKEVKDYFDINDFWKPELRDGYIFFAAYHPSSCLRGAISKEDYIKKFSSINKVVSLVNRTIINLHCHDEYSIKDGICKTEEIVTFAHNIGLKSVSITNHGHIGQIARLYFACKELDMKPIFGCELYVNEFRLDESVKAENKELFRKNNHLVIYAQNKVGLENLIKITSDAFLNGFYYSPRTDLDFISNNSEGLIGSSACMGGSVSSLLMKDDYKGAKKELLRLKKVFNNKFYLELMCIEYDEQIKLNKDIIKLSRDTGVKMIITFDSHYIREEDNRVQDMLLLMKRNQTLKDLEEGKSFRFKTRDLYYKRYIDIYRYWTIYLKKILSRKEFEEIVDNTNNIADMIDNIELDTSIKLYEFGDDYNKLKNLVSKHAKNMKLKDRDNGEEYFERLKFELSVIKNKDFAPYFLIMYDLVSWAEQNDIIVGPGRGSAAGSLLCYVLGITKIDPIKFNLLFERFINIDRDELPDIDTDFDSRNRDDVVAYILKRYNGYALPIGTYSLFKTRAIIYDMLRVHNANYQDVKSVIKKIDSSVDNMSWEEIEEEYPDFKKLVSKYPEAYLYSKRLRNQIRNVSKHAAGLIISKNKIYGDMPTLCSKGEQITAFQDGSDYRTLSKLGYVKFDILSLNNLSVIKDAVKAIKERHNVDIDIFNLPIDDKKAFKLINNFKLGGIFQFESRIARNVIESVRVNSFSDISAISALMRPGPLRSNLHVEYAKAKKRGKFDCIESIRDILSETHGLIIYQEQIMLIAQRLADFELSEANTLRKALFKYSADKKIEIQRVKKVQSYREKFVENSVKKGHDRDEVEKLWDIIYQFASYGFNKSHAISYSMISYVELYLKAYYPLEFMYALLRNTSRGVANSRNKLNEYILEANSMGIKVLSPDINNSKDNFSIHNDSLLFGMHQIKSIGKSAKKIYDARPIETFDKFLKLKINKSASEALISSGAFDDINNDREFLIEEYYKTRKDDIEDLNIRNMEIEYLGICLDDIVKINKLMKNNKSIISMADISGANSYCVGKLVELKKHKTKTGRYMAFLKFQDSTGEYDVIAWNKFYSENKDDLVIDNFYIFIANKNDRGSIIIEEIKKNIGRNISK